MAINLEEIGDIYAKLEELGTATLDTYFTNYDILGSDKATIISSTITTMLQTAVQSQLQVGINEAQIKIAELEAEGKEYEVLNILPLNKSKIEEEIDLLQTQESELLLNGTSRRSIESSQKLKIDKETSIADIAYQVANSTSADKIAMSGYSKLEAEAKKDITVGSKSYKILEAQYTADNIRATRDLTDERKTQLITSVTFNNYAKAVDSQSEWLAMYVGNGGTLNDTMLLPMLEGVEALLTSNVNYTFTFNPDSVSI